LHEFTSNPDQTEPWPIQYISPVKMGHFVILSVCSIPLFAHYWNGVESSHFMEEATPYTSEDGVISTAVDPTKLTIYIYNPLVLLTELFFMYSPALK